MINPHAILNATRTLGHRLFLQFGLHCATHQIRVLLISCVVITSLFYPALSIYTSSQPKSVSIIDNFIFPSSTSKFNAHQDLDAPWVGHNTLRVHEDAVSRAKCGVGRALRVERILIQGPMETEEEALNPSTLLSTLDLEQRLNELLSKSETPCLLRSDGRCLVLSPLLFWQHDRDALTSDPNILETLGYSKNVSVSGIDVTPRMVLAGRGSNQHPHTNTFDFAMFLALTYFFPESDCLGNAEHTAWLKTVQEAASHSALLSFQIEEPTLVALEHDANPSNRDGWSALSALLYMAYIGFFAYVTWSMRRMDAVHSRLGVTFTALVEIAVSTITSLSVCALVGFKVTMVPWELLPIVIVFVGAENMFNLVDAVGKTPVTLSVKQRIAEGLSRAGTSNTLKVVSYNSILGVIAVFSVGAIRQFCIFAIVVLVAHWFLAHTFFIAVLSIDIQRLTLDELLRQDSGIGPSIPHIKKVEREKPSESGWRTLVTSLKNLLRGRATTNISLLILLAITATLYYTTYSASPLEDTQELFVTPFNAVPRAKFNNSDHALAQKNPALQIWKTFNPAKTPLLHLRIEAPTILSFSAHVANLNRLKHAKSHRHKLSRRTFHLMFWFFKSMVLPIAATTGLLWGLLLYLLKDAELLEAQRNRSGPSSLDNQDSGSSLDGEVNFTTMARAFSSDVELLTSSKSGQTVASVGLHSEIAVWRMESEEVSQVDVRKALARGPSARLTITCAAVDEFGEYLAVGLGTGEIIAWSLGTGGEQPVGMITTSPAAITGMEFLHTNVRSPDTLAAAVPDLIAVSENGVAIRWGGLSTPQRLIHSRQSVVVKASLLRVGDSVYVAFHLNNGSLELLDAHPFPSPSLPPDLNIQAGNPLDNLLLVHACTATIDNTRRLVIVAATEYGAISIWDGSTGECITSLDEIFGRISKLHISPVACETCRFCGHPPAESLILAFSVDDVVMIWKVYITNDQSRRCSCSQQQQQTQPRQGSSRDSLDRRSRSNSALNSPKISPRSARLSSAMEHPPGGVTPEMVAAAFPVSGHGVHSRRASEKDTSARRSLDTLTVPQLHDHLSDQQCEGDASRSPVGPSSPVWRNVVVSNVGRVACERGSWAVVGGSGDVAGSSRVIGVRRKPRIPGSRNPPLQTNSLASPLSPSSPGLSRATLDRWEVWIFDPASLRLRSSTLSALESPSIKESRSSFTSSRSSTSHPPSSSPVEPPLRTECHSVPRLPFTRISPLVAGSSKTAYAGFGNTVGVFKLSPPS